LPTPSTIASLKRAGFKNLSVTCGRCKHAADVPIASLGLDVATGIRNIPFACSKCGNRGERDPTWETHRYGIDVRASILDYYANQRVPRPG
jgi:hypothetical protein